MYWVAGLFGFPIQNVSVRADSGASRPSVVCTVAPSGTWAIAALSAATCGLIWYVEACQMPLTGNWKASATVIAAIIAAPCRAAAIRVDVQSSPGPPPVAAAPPAHHLGGRDEQDGHRGGVVVPVRLPVEVVRGEEPQREAGQRDQ